MYDNKIRLSQDVLEKAEIIAQEWGLKNARAAVEAVFRRYADEYLGRRSGVESQPLPPVAPPAVPNGAAKSKSQPSSCDALNELDDLLGL
ncbi:MAG: hypothetical protein IGS48_03580 [Oscillatoriales cyanobacterium C42_A2020_001]|nr:hypothetical protein [Leptolyngbyaceae cyanobacterium C42_A2020_001]